MSTGTVSARHRVGHATRRWAALGVLGLSLAVVASMGCGAKSPVGADDPSRSILKKPTGPEPPVVGHMIASVTERTLGPFFARRPGTGSAALAAWVTVAEGTGRRILVVPLDGRGAPRGGEVVAANVSVDTTMLIARPIRGRSPGFLLAWTSLTDRGKSLWSVALGDNGLPRAKPVELTRTNDDIVWVDVVPTDQGGVCLWAEETRGSDANIVAAPIDTDGHVRGTATRVATGVVGWHALEVPRGFAVSTVTVDTSGSPPPSPQARALRNARPGGALSFQRFDGDAQKIGPPVAITSKPIVSGDIEVVHDSANPKRWVFAWTDRSGEEPAVMMAAASLPEAPTKDRTPEAPAKNAIDEPRRVVEARGGASLLSLASGPAGIGVLFEAPVRRKGETRRVHAAHVTDALALDRHALSLEVVGRGQPELAATASGFVALATTPDCDHDSPLCANAKAVATMHRIDPQGTLVQREALGFISDPATLAWGMSCEDEVCYSLAASPGPPGTPSRIRAVAVRPRANTPKSAATAPSSAPGSTANGPRVLDVSALSSGESVHDLATATIGDGVVVASLTAPKLGDSAPTSRHATPPLTLTTRLLNEGGESTGAHTITTRAIAVGGVAIAGADKPENGGAVAWVSRESGDPEVHVTRIDKRGRRMSDVQLTTMKGDASDVTITWANNGWIVAWVDGRDGNGEVYATKVSTDLTRIAREERITNAPGDATDLVALAHGSDVWLAWADPRESPKEGLADVFVTAVRMKDAKRSLDEQRVLPTAAHSRTPHLANGPSDKVYIAWIEEAPLGSETPSSSGYGAFFARLDAAGKPLDRPMRLPVAAHGAASAVTLDTNGTHAVIARSTSDAISLDAVDLTSSAPSATALLMLDGPPSLDVALVLESGVLYFNDDGPRPADRRARRARIAWTK